MTRRRLRVDLVEVILILVFVGVVAYRVGGWRGAKAVQPPWQHPEDRALAETLRRKYGPQHYSAYAEEWIIRDFFRDMRGGVFADIGAADWRVGSNTYTLERDLGWSGLAVDAAPGYAEGWRRNRPRSRFVQAIVDAVDGQPRTLYFLPEQPIMSSVDKTFTAMFAGTPQTVRGTSARLDTLLAQAGITKLDFLSMDIEQAEPEALRGFSVDRYRPALVCIEAHPPVRQRIFNYFARAGYVEVGKYRHFDNSNVYFAPLERMN
jgi:FkbM family methyltransferase